MPHTSLINRVLAHYDERIKEQARKMAASTALRARCKAHREHIRGALPDRWAARVRLVFAFPADTRGGTWLGFLRVAGGGDGCEVARALFMLAEVGVSYPEFPVQDLIVIATELVEKLRGSWGLTEKVAWDEDSGWVVYAPFELFAAWHPEHGVLVGDYDVHVRGDRRVTESGLANARAKLAMSNFVPEPMRHWMDGWNQLYVPPAGGYLSPDPWLEVWTKVCDECMGAADSVVIAHGDPDTILALAGVAYTPDQNTWDIEDGNLCVAIAGGKAWVLILSVWAINAKIIHFREEWAKKLTRITEKETHQ